MKEFDAGLDAYLQGDYATTLNLWTNAATAGDVRAQYNLGVLYDQGDRIPKNDAQALGW